jgi:hypothetical protein
MEGGAVRRSAVCNVSCPISGRAKHHSASTSENPILAKVAEILFHDVGE